MHMVDQEERRQQEELKQQRRRAQHQQRREQQQERIATASTLFLSNSLNQQHQLQLAPAQPQPQPLRSPLKQVASNQSVHKRNLWIKCALLEKKLVPIVEFLAAQAHKYYEPEALMANRVGAQLLCSLLVGPSALEFSRSKTNDYYQFEEPSADELLKRHKLSNPIACLCNSHSYRDLTTHGHNHRLPRHNHQVAAGRRWSKSTSGAGRAAAADKRAPPTSPGAQLARSATDSAEMRATPGGVNEEEEPPRSRASSASNDNKAQRVALVRGGSQRRRRPLSLRTNLKTGALVTECHHYPCQEISEHQQTRGYSFRSASGASMCSHVDSWPSSVGGGGCDNGSSHLQANGRALPPHSPCQANGGAHLHQDSSICAAAQWPLWSPRMLHETLHQNSRSSLLYAKNNILLETHAHGTMAGYLSLHHHTGSCDLILKWIPNQLINGGQSCAGTQLASGADMGACNRWQSTAQTVATTVLATDDNAKEQQVAIEANGAQASAAPAGGVGGSYLDLVVNLSVSRIVLLHCHFNGLAMSSGESSASAQTTTTSCGSEPADQGNQIQQQQQGQQQQPDEYQQPADPNPLADIEETLVLVEADGVQRAPFKFPKGGLRWFLSCLETGLRPARFLEPALGPNEPFDGAGGGGGGASDPFGPLRLIEHSSFWTASDGCLEPPLACANESGTSNSTSTSRFDMLLRRLPSLKRSGAGRAQAPAETSGSTCGSRVTSPSPSQAASEHQDWQQARPTMRRAVNYVYRIVAARQPEWPLQTPPLSALSFASSSSGGGGGGGGGGSLAANGNATRPTAPKSASIVGAKDHHQACRNSSVDCRNQNQPGQIFRWSLSRLAHFSSRGGSSSSISSAFGLIKSTIDSVDSLNGVDPPMHTQDTQPENLAINSAIRRDSSSELIRIEAKLEDLRKSSSEEHVGKLRDKSIASLCESMRKQILARAFYGWLAYCRRVKLVRTHLAELLLASGDQVAQHQQQVHHLVDYEDNIAGLTRELWQEITSEKSISEARVIELRRLVCGLVYRGGVADDALRREVWPYLLGYDQFGDSPEMRGERRRAARDAYDSARREWTQIERVVRQRDSEILAANMAKVARRRRRELAALSTAGCAGEPVDGAATANATAASETTSGQESMGDHEAESDTDDLLLEHSVEGEPPNEGEQVNREPSAPKDVHNNNAENEQQEPLAPAGGPAQSASARSKKARRRTRARRRRRFRLESTGSLGSDASITDQFGNNIHRIDKDVQRCDRNFCYFKEQANLDKLRQLMCSYVWQHLDVGYVQGMCDLAAPILVIFDSDELLAYECFNRLMMRMVANFPHGNAMDKHLEHLKYLMQVLDPKLFEVLQNNGDYTHFYFCYRWLLLDFKRELAYEDVYRVWETIWAASHVASEHFVVFLALAMVRFYRDIIIENNMDFTDTIKFFNEMAERHDAKKIIALAQDCVLELESLMYC